MKKIILVALAFLSTLASAQNMSQMVPEPSLIEDAYVPRFNHYVLFPGEGFLYVQYLGAFKTPDGVTSAKVVFPLPEGFTDPSFKDIPDAKFTQTKLGLPVAELSLKPGINELRVDFKIATISGKVKWENNNLNVPGVYIFTMPEYKGALRSLLEPLFPNINIWPARVINVDSSLNSSTFVQESEQVSTMGARAPHQTMRRLLRMSKDTTASFPHFTVVGIVPDRLTLYALAGLFAAAFFGIAVYVLRSSVRVKSLPKK